MKYFLLIFIIVAFYISEFESNRRHKEVLQAISKRSHLDSMYWGHLETCSFINADSIYVDKRGIVRVHLAK